jgi:dTDP-4-amino-4,6-dideoxygalactose transaminase
MPHGFSITVKPDTRKISDLISIFDENFIHWKRNFGFCGDHPALSEYDDLDDYKWAKWCGNNGIHIGCHRFMSHDDVDRIKECLAEFFED